MANSIWTWIGGTIDLQVPTDWALTGGPGNTAGIPQAGDAAINSTGRILAGAGLIAAALVNNGTVVATNNSVLGSSTGGTLEIAGTVSGTGVIDIAPGAVLKIDGALGHWPDDQFHRRHTRDADPGITLRSHNQHHQRLRSGRSDRVQHWGDDPQQPIGEQWHHINPV
jgi:hypothetical protein